MIILGVALAIVMMVLAATHQDDALKDVAEITALLVAEITALLVIIHVFLRRL